MIKTLTGCLLLFGCFNILIAQDIVTPKVWLRADKDTTSNIQWADFSGNDNHVQVPTSQVGSEKQYFNFNPTRHFIESDNWSSIPFSLEGLSGTTFMVVYQSKDTVERGILGTKDGLERNVMLSTRRVLGPDSIIDVFEHSSKSVFMNTITQNWEESKLPVEGATMTLGGIVNTEDVKGFEGSLAEVLVFNEVIPFLNRVQFETYLGIKYGVPLKDRNYVSSGEVVLWKADENEEFQYRITGIGRDDYFQLYQRQSKSSDDSLKLIALSAGELKETNADNSTQFSDQDFILWGDNDGLLIDYKGEGEDSILSVLDRKWLVTVNGNTAKNISTNIQFDISHLPPDSLGYWLVVDRSGTNNFSADNLVYFKADSISQDSVAYYNNLKWDSDFSGKDNFSFSSVRNLFAVVRTLNKPICTDPESGRVKIEVIEGTSPFEFEWTLSGSDQSTKYTSEDSIVIDNLVEGTYDLRVKDAQGVLFQRSMELKLADDVPVDLGPDQALESGTEIILDASLSIPDSLEVDYAWESSFGLSSSKEKITVTESGIYRVFVTNKANGCVFVDDVVISGSPIQRFEVFPNLINQNQEFNISISLQEPVEVQLRLYDLKGNLHAELNGENSSEYQFQVSLSKAGHYMVVLETPEESSTKKIIVY